MTRVLALDYGSARCGCAVSDPTGTLATPLDAVAEPRSEQGMARIAALAADLGAERVVVGLPVSLSGEEGAQAAEARGFATLLAEAVTVPVETYDERFTSALARRTPGRTSEDSRAAAHMLDTYLQSRRGEDA